MRAGGVVCQITFDRERLRRLQMLRQLAKTRRIEGKKQRAAAAAAAAADDDELGGMGGATSTKVFEVPLSELERRAVAQMLRQQVRCCCWGW